MADQDTSVNDVNPGPHAGGIVVDVVGGRKGSSLRLVRDADVAPVVAVGGDQSTLAERGVVELGDIDRPGLGKAWQDGLHCGDFLEVADLGVVNADETFTGVAECVVPRRTW